MQIIIWLLIHYVSLFFLNIIFIFIIVIIYLFLLLCISSLLLFSVTLFVIFHCIHFFRLFVIVSIISTLFYSYGFQIYDLMMLLYFRYVSNSVFCRGNFTLDRM